MGAANMASSHLVIPYILYCILYSKLHAGVSHPLTWDHDEKRGKLHDALCIWGLWRIWVLIVCVLLSPMHHHRLRHVPRSPMASKQVQVTQSFGCFCYHPPCRSSRSLTTSSRSHPRNCRSCERPTSPYFKITLFNVQFIEWITTVPLIKRS